MKLIGIILIFLSVSFVGYEIGNKYISELKGIKRAEILLKNIILCLENENMTLKEIGESIEVSESRVCQIHAQAIMKLRNILNKQNEG